MIKLEKKSILKNEEKTRKLILIEPVKKMCC